MIEHYNSKIATASLWEFSPDGLVLVDLEGRIVEINRAAEALFGYTRRELMGRPLEILMPERYRPAHAGHLARYFAAPTTRPMSKALELFALRKDGSEFPVQISLSPLENGRASYAMAAVRDATEQYRLHKQTARSLEWIHALREVESALATTLELRQVLEIVLEKIEGILPGAGCGVRLVDSKTGNLHHIVTRNIDLPGVSAALAKAGRGYADIVQERGATVLIEDIRSQPIPRLTEFLQTQGVVGFLGFPLVVQGKTVGVLSVFAKEARQYSKDEVEFFTALSSQAAVAIHNAQLYETQVNVTAQLEQALAVREEFLGFVSHELKSPLNVINGHLALLLDKAFGEITEEQEASLKQMAASANELLAMIQSLLAANKLDSGSVTAVTEELPLNEFLDELKAAYAVSVKKSLDLHWEYSADLPVMNTDRDKLKHILQNLINNAIRFTDQGTVTVSARAVEKSEQLAVSGEQSSVVGGQRLAISCQPSALSQEEIQNETSSTQNSKPETRNCDLQTQHPRPQTLDSHCPTLDPRPETQNASGMWVEFTVEDTGIGIPKEDLPYIFERFRQAQGAANRRLGGIGLGLDIAKKFSVLLGGTIGVESKPGKGSVFIVKLPLEHP